MEGHRQSLSRRAAPGRGLSGHRVANGLPRRGRDCSHRAGTDPLSSAASGRNTNCGLEEATAMTEGSTPEIAGIKLDTSTRLAFERTYLAHERTQMAWV